MTFCLANALTYSIIFNSQFCFYPKGILEGIFGFYERRTCNSQISKGLYDAVTNRLGQQQAYESSSILYFLYFEIISQHLLLGFPLKCSIDIRTSKIFLFCTANLIFVQGDCSIGCFQGST